MFGEVIGSAHIQNKTVIPGTLSALTAKGWNVFDTLQNNDAYHALKAVDGLIITGATGTNVNDAAVALVGEE